MTSTIAILGASGLVGRSIISELGASDERILVFVGRDQTRLSAAAEAVVDAGSASPFTLAIGDDRDWAAILDRVPRPNLGLNLVGPATAPAPPGLHRGLRNPGHHREAANELEAFPHT